MDQITQLGKYKGGGFVDQITQLGKYKDGGLWIRMGVCRAVDRKHDSIIDVI